MRAVIFRTQAWERTLAFVTAFLLIGLGWATNNAIGAGGGDLNFERWWPFGLALGGVMAFVAAFHHTQMTWSITTAWLTTMMIGRGIDLVVNTSEFSSRIFIAQILWIGGGVLAGVAWLAVGAMTDALVEDG